MPHVSIIMRAYNAAGTITKALEPLRGQTVPDLEIIVVDDQSKDETYHIAQKIAETDRRVKIFQMPQNSGASMARRIGMEHATGEWMTLCDADDWYKAERIE